MGFRSFDAQRNVMSQSTEMSPLVSMLFRTFLNLFKFLMEIFNIPVLMQEPTTALPHPMSSNVLARYAVVLSLSACI